MPGTRMKNFTDKVKAKFKLFFDKIKGLFKKEKKEGE
jgi:hypothetical protein